MITSIFKINRPYKRVVSFGIKLGIIGLLIWILYVQVFQKNELSGLISQFNASLQKEGNWLFLILAVIMVPLNWFLESFKWKKLINNFQEFNIINAIRSVLSGVSLAIMTPGRIGEYGGRLVGIQKENQPQAILANLISSLSQNIINVGLGLIGTLFFLQKFFPLHQSIFLSLVFIGACIISVMLLVYFRIDLLYGILAYLPDWKWIDKIRSSVTVFREMDSASLFSILGIALLRYLTYSAQYVLLIFFFGVSNDMLSSILGVMTVFFFQSNLPLPPALSVLARGEMAIYLWSVFTSNILGIIAASFSLWIINLVVPAIFGAAIITQTKIFED